MRTAKQFRYVLDPVCLVCIGAYLLYRFWVRRTWLAEIPFFPVMPGLEALLPASAVWLLVGVWAVFAATLARVVLGTRRHLPKTIYLANSTPGCSARALMHGAAPRC